ncbi:like-Sm domain-containing protein [Xylaria castorea]|nr:like-Sm domain-containing protein [Xylaria castorea]
MTSTIGIPIKLLNEAQGHIVTLEITSGQTYRGKLLEAEDNMNVQLKDITVTARDGRVSHLDQVYIRGSHVRFFIVPDMLKFVHAINIPQTPPCSEVAMPEVAVSVWPEGVPLLAERGPAVAAAAAAAAAEGEKWADEVA